MNPKYKYLTSEQIMALSSDELVSTFRSFVFSIVNSMNRSILKKIEKEDLEAYGILGLLEAHSRFQVKKGTKFTTFAYYRIRGAILDGCRKEEGGSMRGLQQIFNRNEYPFKNISTDSPLQTQLSFPETKCGCASDNDIEKVYDLTKILEQYEGVHRNQIRTLLLLALDTLENIERDILIRHYLESETMEHISIAYGVSKSWLSRINKIALTKMFNELRRIGFESF